MKKTSLKQKLSVILSFVLIAVIALVMVGCNSNTPDDNITTTRAPDDNTTTTRAPVQTTEAANPTALGEGAVQFSFSVTHKDGKVVDFVINTDKKTVGEALLELELIAGDVGNYGLYVKTVDGETLDYDTDAMYWAFYENGGYAATGVDQTEIIPGATYEFRAEA